MSRPRLVSLSAHATHVHLEKEMDILLPPARRRTAPPRDVQSFQLVVHFSPSDIPLWLLFAVVELDFQFSFGGCPRQTVLV